MAWSSSAVMGRGAGQQGAVDDGDVAVEFGEEAAGLGVETQSEGTPAV